MGRYFGDGYRWVDTLVIATGGMLVLMVELVMYMARMVVMIRNSLMENIIVIQCLDIIMMYPARRHRPPIETTAKVKGRVKARRPIRAA